MDNDTEITATRAELVEAFRTWDAQARAGNWPDEQDSEASADHLITLICTAQA